MMMKKFLMLGFSLLTVAGFAQEKFQAINLDYMDTDVRPQDDFYNFVNGNWMKTAEIPSDRARRSEERRVGKECGGRWEESSVEKQGETGEVRWHRSERH